MSACMYIYEHVSANSQSPEKVLDPLEVLTQVVVRHLMRVMGRAISAS